MITASALHRHAALAMAAAMAIAGSVAWAQGGHHTFVDPAKLNWTAVPSLPPGAQLAVIEGPMNEAGPFTVRLKFPANYRVTRSIAGCQCGGMR